MKKILMTMMAFALTIAAQAQDMLEVIFSTGTEGFVEVTF